MKYIYLIFSIFSFNGFCADNLNCRSFFAENNLGAKGDCPTVSNIPFPQSFEYHVGQTFHEANCNGTINYFTVGSSELIGQPNSHNVVDPALQPRSPEYVEIVLKRLQKPEPYLCEKNMDFKKCFKAQGFIGSLIFSNTGLTDPDYLRSQVQGTGEDISASVNSPIHVGREWSIDNKVYTLFNTYKPVPPSAFDVTWANRTLVTQSYFCRPESSISDSTIRENVKTNPTNISVDHNPSSAQEQ